MITNEKKTFDPKMVNYTSVSTSAANEFYQSKTDLPDSLAFMIKDNVIVKFDLIDEEQKNPDEDTSINIITY